MVIIQKEIMEQLSKELSLPYTGTEQDWDIEMADSNRIDEFIKFYNESNLCDDKKVAVMALILSSYDDLLNENNLEIDKRWKGIRLILKSEKLIFNDLIEYWSLNDKKDIIDLFKITPLVRTINTLE